MAEMGSGNGSDYPGTLDTNNTLEVDSPNAGKTKARADVPNDHAAAIVALENELGTDPAGTLTNVKTYLQTEHGTDGTHGDITVTSMNSTGTVKWAKGSDVASATALSLGTDGNYFDITGTTTITSIDTIKIGTIIKLHFDAVLILTHHATNLFLPTEANITTAVGDEAEFIEYATGDWRCTNYQRATGSALTGGLVQHVNTQDSAVATGTVLIAFDDNIPQNTQGDEYMTLAITPTNTNNKLIIEFEGLVASSAVGTITTALFQDSTAGALKANGVTLPAINAAIVASLSYEMVAGTTSSTTFKIRIGSSAASTTTFNGASGARKYGGVAGSFITIKEVTA